MNNTDVDARAHHTHSTPNRVEPNKKRRKAETVESDKIKVKAKFVEGDAVDVKRTFRVRTFKKRDVVMDCHRLLW